MDGNTSWEYDVFLSFHGDDTRRNFVDHLHAALVRTGIETFVADKSLESGEDIFRGLLKAIRDSRIAIVVFSENYASSTWCLDELVQILECKETRKQVVLPVFYHVNPSDVRSQRGHFGDGFEICSSRVGVAPEEVEKRRQALKTAGYLAGLHLTEDSHEAEEVEEIVSEVQMKLSNPRNLVGIDRRSREVVAKLDIEGSGTKVEGIWTFIKSSDSTRTRRSSSFNCTLKGVVRRSVKLPSNCRERSPGTAKDFLWRSKNWD